MRRARAIAAMHDRDLQVGQLQPRIERGDARVVPARDLAQVDVGERCAVQRQLTVRDARQVDGRDNRARDHVELFKPRLFAGFGAERRVRAGEIDSSGLDLADAGRRADGLVVDLRAPLGLRIGITPFLVERRRKASARAVEFKALSGGRRRQG